MPSPELQSPTSWMWKPCTWFGLRWITCAVTRTLSPICSRLTSPSNLFPVVGLSPAVARGVSCDVIVWQPARTKTDANASAIAVLMFSFPPVGMPADCTRRPSSRSTAMRNGAPRNARVVLRREVFRTQAGVHAERGQVGRRHAKRVAQGLAPRSEGGAHQVREPRRIAVQGLGERRHAHHGRFHLRRRAK